MAETVRERWRARAGETERTLPRTRYHNHNHNHDHNQYKGGVRFGPQPLFRFQGIPLGMLNLNTKAVCFFRNHNQPHFNLSYSRAEKAM